MLAGSDSGLINSETSMLHRLASLIAVVALATSSFCRGADGQVLVRYQLTGRLLDATTEQPIPGARLRVYRWTDRGRNRSRCYRLSGERDRCPESRQPR